MSENEPTSDEGTAVYLFDEALAALAAKTAASEKADKTYFAARVVWEKIEALRYGTSDGDSRLSKVIGLARRYGPKVAALGGGGSVIGGVATALAADDGGFGDLSSLFAIIGQLFGSVGGAP